MVVAGRVKQTGDEGGGEKEEEKKKKKKEGRREREEERRKKEMKRRSRRGRKKKNKSTRTFCLLYCGPCCLVEFDEGPCLVAEIFVFFSLLFGFFVCGIYFLFFIFIFFERILPQKIFEKNNTQKSSPTRVPRRQHVDSPSLEWSV